jgi:hypothetical protein
MKTLRTLVSLIVLTFASIFNHASGQGQIISLTPNTAYVGQTSDIVIRGMGTSFKNGITRVDFGQDVTINRVTVQNTTTLDVQVTVSGTAAVNPSGASVTITTGSDVVMRPNALVIAKTGSSVTATIIVTPIQSMHLSDFDPNNLANSPLLFSVIVYNDGVQRDLLVSLNVSGQASGGLVTATKVFRGTQPNAVLRFDNRQFDKYRATNPNSPTVQKAIQTGALPADQYTYEIVVTDLSVSGPPLCTADGTNTITNDISKPELIGPGNPFYSDPIAVHVKTPVFQWFSKGNTYDFFLYEVMAGQKTKEEVALNRPLFSESGLTTTTFLYPSSAPVMESGKVYAWQIVANYNGTTGLNQLSSDLFWFTMVTSSTTSGHRTVADLKVSPEAITVGAGQAYKFNVKAFDLNNDTITVAPTWTVVPAEGGTVDRDGNFIAGQGPNIVAVIASFGEFTDYSTVTINAGGEPTGDAGNLDKMVRQMYGLPK